MMLQARAKMCEGASLVVELKPTAELGVMLDGFYRL